MPFAPFVPSRLRPLLHPAPAAPLLVSYASRGSNAHDASRNIGHEAEVLAAIEKLSAKLGFKFERVDFGCAFL